MEKRPAQETARRIGDYIEQIYSRGSVLGDDGAFHDIGVVAVNRYRGAFVAGRVRAERPRATFEVGMAWGLSTLFILQALLENGDDFRPHLVIDPFQSSTYHNAARRSLRELGIEELVEFREERSELAMPQLVREGRQFDLGFIDGSHRFDCVMTDLRFADLLLRPGGVAVLDDTDWDSVYLVCRFAEANYGYQPAGSLAPPHRRRRRFRPITRPPIRAYRKPIEEIRRPLGFFAPFFKDFKPIVRLDPAALRQEGLAALAAGDRSLARAKFAMARRLDPAHFKTYLRLLRTYLPIKAARALGAKARRAASIPPQTDSR